MLCLSFLHPKGYIVISLLLKESKKKKKKSNCYHVIDLDYKSLKKVNKMKNYLSSCTLSGLAFFMKLPNWGRENNTN